MPILECKLSKEHGFAADYIAADGDGMTVSCAPGYMLHAGSKKIAENSKCAKCDTSGSFTIDGEKPITCSKSCLLANFQEYYALMNILLIFLLSQLNFKSHFVH